ncbi:hypothetical protein SAMN00120144_2158 [Hymenobacter roseosalivarius DSM 11622]|uniref:Uncharacterized protein n=1 Tax=Hymenobacter roseosalivarius DSM 11622 TaxID=645990 RepID=A0A1W1VGJ7_9BACT|nr:hypothetical protein SAMN00120144_2158 [Hymenobacter roseosalivarius DSM 11622]
MALAEAEVCEALDQFFPVCLARLARAKSFPILC